MTREAVKCVVLPMIALLALCTLSARPARAELVPVPGVPAIAEAEACVIAGRALRVPVANARLVARDGRLVWQAAPRGADVPTAPVVLVDATTGKVVEARDRARHASALTYAENPVRTPTATLLPLPSFAPAVRSCVDQGKTAAVTLAGNPATVRTCALLSVATPDGSGDFTAPPRARPVPARNDADAFAETSAHWHAGKLLDFVGGLDGTPALPALAIVAGVRIASGLLAGDLVAAADPARDLVAFPQSFFLPGPGSDEGAAYRAIYGVGTGAVWLGQGTNVDLAYDGDVVAHETTHAVVAATLGLAHWRLRADGLSDEPAALNEALADYFAAALSNDPVVGEYAATESAVTAALLRSLVNDTTCSTIDGEPHDDSAVLSGALWKTRLVDPAGVDRAVYAAMKAGVAPDLGFDGFAARLSPLLPDAARTTFVAEVAARAMPCAPVLTLGATPIRNALRPFAAPGTLATGTSIAPGIVQLRFDLPAGTQRATVSFTGTATVTTPLVVAPATPFHPVVLAGWDHPLHWTAGTSDADATILVEGAASFGAELVPPAGTKAVWIQIANDGEGDGSYDALAVSFDALGTDAAAPPAVDASAPDASVSAPAVVITIAAGGGGCATGGATPSGALPLFLVLAWKTRRRRTASAIPRPRS